MVKPVKGRPYDVTHRQQQSSMTRQRILDASRALFIERSYHGTTIAAIATAAGVNADTVYALVGRKPVLLRELIEQALSDTDHAVPAEEREHVIAIRAQVDARPMLEMYAHTIGRTHQRLAPLLLSLGAAAPTEPEAQSVWTTIAERRATNMRKLAADLHRTGQLRPDLSVGETADIIWATNSPELFALLVDQRSWTVDRYEAWLAEMWIRTLLD